MSYFSSRPDFIRVLLQNNPITLQLFVIILNCVPGDSKSWESPDEVDIDDYLFKYCSVKDVRVYAPITYIKLEIPIYFIDHSEFITVQCEKILSRASNEVKCFEFSSIKRALRPHLRTITAI